MTFAILCFLWFIFLQEDSREISTFPPTANKTAKYCHFLDFNFERGLILFIFFEREQLLILVTSNFIFPAKKPNKA